jgi:hypothetical protein
MEKSIETYYLEEQWIASMRALFHKEDERRRRKYAWDHLVQTFTHHPNVKKIVRNRVNILA